MVDLAAGEGGGMHLIPCANRRRLWRGRRGIRDDLPSRARVPDARFVSEVNFHHQHRDLFEWLRLDAPISFRWRDRRWRTAESCLRATEAWVLENPQRDPEQAEKLCLAVLSARYERHAWLRCWLYSTVGLHLRYDNARDVFWGCGPIGSGLNRLGVLQVSYREASVPVEYRHVLQPFTSTKKPKRKPFII